MLAKEPSRLVIAEPLPRAVPVPEPPAQQPQVAAEAPETPPPEPVPAA